VIAERASNSSAKERGRLLKGFSTASNSSLLNTVLPSTSNLVTVIFSGTLPGIASGVGGVGERGGSNCSGGGSGAGVGITLGVWEGGRSLSGKKGGMFDGSGVSGNDGVGVIGLGT
jgi:hypothetical protein